jgi:hypothetical protein
MMVIEHAKSQDSCCADGSYQVPPPGDGWFPTNAMRDRYGNPWTVWRRIYWSAS